MLDKEILQAFISIKPNYVSWNKYLQYILEQMSLENDGTDESFLKALYKLKEELLV